MRLKNWIINKLNPSQPEIYSEYGEEQYSDSAVYLKTIEQAVDSVEAVNRACNMVIDSFSMVNYDVKEPFNFSARAENGIKGKTLHRILNSRPNLDEDISSFRRKLAQDFLYKGEFFIYYDGANIYHLPAEHMVLHVGQRNLVAKYEYGSGDTAVEYSPSEIIHVKDNSVDNSFRGTSRLTSTLNNLNSRRQMIEYQTNFFKNGMAPGIILTTDSIMSTKMKERLIQYWIQKFNPRTGANRPLILDGGMKPENISANDFSKLQYSETMKEIEEKALTAIGVPPVLLNSGNNANLRPNIELFYNMTIIPMAKKFVSALEAFFAWDIKEVTYGIAALAPDMKAEADRITSLVNNGILTGDEGRVKLREEPLGTEEMTTIRIPANIAGSATGVSGQEGGAPTSNEE